MKTFRTSNNQGPQINSISGWGGFFFLSLRICWRIRYESILTSPWLYQCLHFLLEHTSVVVEWGVGGGRVWLWLLWKYSKTKYFKADEKKPTNSWLANGAPFSTRPCTKAAAAWATAACMVASGLSVSNTGLLLVVNGREIVFPLYPPLSFLIVVTLFCLKAAVSHCSLFPAQSNPVRN